MNNKSPHYIVATYGTHVLTQIELGAKLQLAYQSKTTGSERKDAVTAGMSVSIKKIFSVGGEIAYNSNLVDKNSGASLKYKTFGGSAAGLVGSIDLSNPNTPKIDISTWANSCNLSNAVLINVAPNKMINIYDLITDPSKKAAVKVAVEDYTRNRTITYAYILNEYKKSAHHGQSYLTSTFPGNYHEGWRNPGVKIGNLYAENTSRTGTSMVYLFYKLVRTNGGNYENYKLFTNYEEGLRGWTYKGNVGRIYLSAIDNTVIPLYEFYNTTTYQSTYSTNILKYGNGKYFRVGPDGFMLLNPIGYVPK